MKNTGPLWRVVVLNLAVSASFTALAGIEMTSSMMWREHLDHQKFIYPSGIPAVVESHDEVRQFTVEQYFNMPVTSDQFVPEVRGSWTRNSANRLVQTANGWENPYVQVTRPVCEPKGELGTVCTSSFSLSKEIPSGIVSLKLQFLYEDILFTHPHSIYWFVVPEAGEGVSKAVAPSLLSFVVGSADDAKNLRARESLAFASKQQPLQANWSGDPAYNVVRINWGGSFSLGSGFLTTDISAFKPLFNEHIFRAIDLMSGHKVFVVTAAHLFPASDGSSMRFNTLDSSASSLPFDEGFVYDLAVANEQLPASASLIARNVEADVAILMVRREFLPILAQAQGLASVDQITGLTLADHLQAYSNSPEGVKHQRREVDKMRIYGYPAASQSLDENKNPVLVIKSGFVDLSDHPTDDTSNFGVLNKIKLQSFRKNHGQLAEPGMSGGPIIDQSGRVVGIAIEKPNDANTLIALDFVSLKRGAVAKSSYDSECFVQFNPFDRILKIRRARKDCDYGGFGSPQAFSQIYGELVMQEVLAYADTSVVPAVASEEASQAAGGYQYTNGHSIIGGNGHSIINGHNIINGHSIITGNNGNLVRVGADNIAYVNEHVLRDGLKIDERSFKSFTPVGVRVLKVQTVYRPTIDLEGLLVTSTRASVEKPFDEFYSVRSFAIWLHRHLLDEQLAELFTSHSN